MKNPAKIQSAKIREYSDIAAIAAGQHTKEREYWLTKLSGDLKKTGFPYDYKNELAEPVSEIFKFKIPPELFPGLMKLSNNSDLRLNVILVTAMMVVLHKYTGSKDIILGSPVYKQEAETGLINTVLVLKNQVEDHFTFKELLLQVRKTIVEASENYGYPLQLLLEELGITDSEEKFPLSDAALLLENIHDKEYLRGIETAVTFSFRKISGELGGIVEFDGNRYERITIERIVNHFNCILQKSLSHLETPIGQLEMLPGEEKKNLLYNFNNTRTSFPGDMTIQQLFQQQAVRTPDRVAVVGGRQPTAGKEHRVQHLSYRELNAKSNQVAHLLRAKGVKPDMIVGIMVERSIEMIVGILGILKAGGAYLPIDPRFPGNRVLRMLNDSEPHLLLTGEKYIAKHSFTQLQPPPGNKLKPFLTPPRPHITHLDRLPLLNRTLVDYEKYNKFIGLAAVKDSMCLMGSRGCPFKCIYCHKIWPKKHIVRSAENIFSEIQILYNMGIRRFAMLDDIFNLNKENSTRFFQMIIDNNFDLQLFFPNGLRGELLTKEYIRLMILAGTINISLSLETASPRLQKLIKKNLNIKKLRENIDYICENYPQIILDIQTMHGFPTETEEEAMMTMNFIKDTRWIHFPYVHIVKIYRETEMEQMAIEHGISRETIDRAAHQAYHELADTLPFEKSFTLRYQSEFLNSYFLSRERLQHVLPYQMKVMTEDEILQKYSSYLGTELRSFTKLLNFTGIAKEELKVENCLCETAAMVPELNEKLRGHFKSPRPARNALKVLILDVSTFFSDRMDAFYNMIEPPMGAMAVLTYLQQQYGPRINGKIVKSRMDFDNYIQLKALLEEFNPDVIGIRTLTYYKDFFHLTAAMIRQFGIDVPIIAGGPYATSDYTSLLQDRNIDLAVLGEGEITFCQLIGKILENNGTLPGEDILKEIPGIAYISQQENPQGNAAREIIFMEQTNEKLSAQSPANLKHINRPSDLAYVIFTSGSTGKPKGTLISHRNAVRVVRDTNYIELTDNDRVLQLSNYAFDGSVFDIFGALLNRAALVTLSQTAASALNNLPDFIEKQEITVFFATTALFNALIDIKIESFKNIRKILFGGERVTVELTGKALAHLGRGRIIHMYGPTETTVYATYYPVDLIDEKWGTIPIGKPISNTTLYILDKNLNIIPIGTSGEIFIGGDGLSRGYMNNPSLTAGKMIANPFVKNERIYRTGDLGRWLHDGNIEFIGRIDRQVKVRGFRVELEEIEKWLAKLEQVKDVVVVDRKEKSGENSLCAYIVYRAPEPKPTPDAVEIKEYLSRHLPDYMIPAYFVEIEKIPLTSNGKVDKKVLPLPRLGMRGGKYAEPRGEKEKKMLEIWADVLGTDKETLTIDSDFFELGGHSLKATILISRINKEFKIKIQLAEIFRCPTIREFSGCMQEVVSNKYSSIEPAEEKEYYPLSSAQKRMFLLQKMEMGTAYNIPQIIILDGKIHLEAIKKTFPGLIKRHESLRTSFEVVNEEPVQRIQALYTFEIEFSDLSSGSGERASDIGEREIIKNFMRPFDLSKAPLLRTTVIKMAENKSILLVEMHHIISDGFSLQILKKEFAALYKGEELPPVRMQYKDFAQWQNSEKESEAIKKQETFWLNRFEGEIPVLNIPTDYPRPAVKSFEGNSISFNFGVEETKLLKRIALEEGVTLFMLLLSLYTILLSKLTGQEDIVIGSPIAGRRHADLEKIIGMFVNMLVLKNLPEGWKNFKTFLSEVKQGTLAAFENQEYQFEDLVEKVAVNRDIRKNPLVDVMFALQNIGGDGGNTPQRAAKQHQEFRHTVSKFDLTLFAREAGDNLVFSFEYSTRLFKKETIQRFIAYFKIIAAGISKDIEKKICDIEITTGEEKRQILYDFNDTKVEYPTDKTIHSLFAQQAARTPNSIALVGKDERHAPCAMRHAITYRELNRKSDRLARILQAKGVKPNSIAVVMVERSLEMIIGIIAILKAGGAYLPTDPDYPEERKKIILEDSAAKVLLTRDTLIGTDKKLPHSLPPGNVLSIDKLVDGSNEISNLKNLNNPGDLLYVVYTSGSTGIPKGVLVTHGSIVNLVHFHQKTFAEDHNSRMSQVASMGFDAMSFEIWPSLLSGANLYIAGNHVRKDPYLMKKWLIDNKITISFQPTIMVEHLLKEEWPDKGVSLRALRTAGDRLTTYPTHPYPFKLYNLYGPTEDTIWTTWTEVKVNTGNEKYPTIGKPIGNHQVYIVSCDGEEKLQPIGIPGELCIGGKYLAAGYLNRVELTKEKFVENPYTAGGRLYKTGDLARWLADGDIEFLGRIDHQVKLRGFRIELGEIEMRLLKHEEVKEAVVLARRGDTGARYLCAYIVPTTPHDDTSTRRVDISSRLRIDLSNFLPDYMIPSHFMLLEKIPLTPNGKIDRKGLPEPVISAGSKYVAPRDEVEKKLKKLWTEVLDIKSPGAIGIDDNFFGLGGHSLKASILVSKLHKAFNIRVPLVEIFRIPTIRQQAEYIKKKNMGNEIFIPEAEAKNLVLLREKSSEDDHFFFVHDGTGEVDGYIEFCKRLSSEFNYWGLRADRLENPTPQNWTIEELAQKYARKIKKVREKGPYYLAGWSLGGIIAFEMARQLEQVGEECRFLALIDTPAPQRKNLKNANEFTLESELTWLRHYLTDSQIYEKLKDAPGIDKMWHQLVDYLVSNQFDLEIVKRLIPGGIACAIPNYNQLGMEESIYYLNMTRTLENARKHYIPPGKSKVNADFFEASLNEDCWGSYFEKPLTSHTILGDHFSIFKIPDVVEFAKRFDSVLGEAKNAVDLKNKIMHNS